MNSVFDFLSLVGRPLATTARKILIISTKINLKIEDDLIVLKKGETVMNIFAIIGIIVVVLFIAGYFGLR